MEAGRTVGRCWTAEISRSAVPDSALAVMTSGNSSNRHTIQGCCVRVGGGETPPPPEHPTLIHHPQQCIFNHLRRFGSHASLIHVSITSLPSSSCLGLHLHIIHYDYLSSSCLVETLDIYTCIKTKMKKKMKTVFACWVSLRPSPAPSAHQSRQLDSTPPPSPFDMPPAVSRGALLINQPLGVI